MLLLLAKILYLGLPAIVANSLPVIFFKFRWLEFLNKPIDGDCQAWGQPFFGRNKTWRGLAVGISGGIIMILIQRYLNREFSFLEKISLLDYESWGIILAGFLMAFGALFGDLVKSFLKRRLKKNPGFRWWPWDNLDATLGALIFINLYKILDWPIVLGGLIIGMILHILSNLISYKLKIKKVWW